ncbi:hypothetical protein EES43_16255 [Streptomyces sp. ADI96-02]|nr:hypothetical protein EES43_16255 [Streptomyces sp. ADI96-02]
MSQFARLSWPVTVMVLPFFTGSGEAFTVSLEKRCTTVLAIESFSTSSPSFVMTAAPTRHVPAFEFSSTYGSKVTVIVQVDVVALTSLHDGRLSLPATPMLFGSSRLVPRHR